MSDPDTQVPLIELPPSPPPSIVHLHCQQYRRNSNSSETLTIQSWSTSSTISYLQEPSTSSAHMCLAGDFGPVSPARSLSENSNNSHMSNSPSSSQSQSESFVHSESHSTSGSYHPSEINRHSPNPNHPSPSELSSSWLNLDSNSDNSSNYSEISDYAPDYPLLNYNTQEFTDIEE